MAGSQNDYWMQFVDRSAFTQSSNNSMAYDFSQQGAYFMPMTQAAFVAVPMARVSSTEVPASTDNQDANTSSEHQQCCQAPMSQSRDGTLKEKRPSGGRKQKDTP